MAPPAALIQHSGQWALSTRQSVLGILFPEASAQLPGGPRTRQSPFLCFRGSHGQRTWGGDRSCSLPNGDCHTCPETHLHPQPRVSQAQDGQCGEPWAPCPWPLSPAPAKSPPGDRMSPGSRQEVHRQTFIFSLGPKKRKEKVASVWSVSHWGVQAKGRRGPTLQAGPLLPARPYHIPPVGKGCYPAEGWSSAGLGLLPQPLTPPTKFPGQAKVGRRPSFPVSEGRTEARMGMGHLRW